MDNSAIVGSSSSKRAIGDRIRFLPAPYTAGIFNLGFFPFSRVNPMCRRSGSFLSPFSYLGGFAPSVALCALTDCGIYIPSGVTITASEFNGIMPINLNYLGMANGGGLSLGTPGVVGFQFFRCSTQIEINDALSYVGNGGLLKMPVGGAIVVLRLLLVEYYKGVVLFIRYILVPTENLTAASVTPTAATVASAYIIG